MTALQLAIGGAGIARISNLTVGRAVSEGRLVQLFRESHAAEVEEYYRRSDHWPEPSLERLLRALAAGTAHREQ